MIEKETCTSDVLVGLKEVAELLLERVDQGAFQLQEYQTDMGRCRFDTPGKLTPAHRAGPPTVRGRWVCPAWWVSASATAACPPTRRGTFYCPWAVGESLKPGYMATHRAGHFSLSLSGGWIVL